LQIGKDMRVKLQTSPRPNDDLTTPRRGSMAHVLTFQKSDVPALRALRKSGCQELFIGIESGSPRILRSINKTHKIETVIENLTKVFKAKIDMKGYFIYGFPGETEEDMEMTFQLAERLKTLAISEGVKFRTSVFQYRPYHATEIFHDLVQEGKILPLEHVTENKALSDMVGRIQFNFHSGNYSEVDLDRVHQYIYRTTNLNDRGLFNEIDPIDQPANK
jgi:anaerobic magnesium-protoporphyrin IX monomethyl ester cyclase